MAINSSAKGKSGEKYVVNLLKEWWGDERFMRNWMGQSGAVGTQMAGRTDVSEDMMANMSGDVICPPGFPFVIESKFYKEIDLYAILRNPENADPVLFWRQSKNDADRCNRMPLVVMRENRKKAYVITALEPKPETPSLEFKVDGETVRILTWDDFCSNFPRENWESV